MSMGGGSGGALETAGIAAGSVALAAMTAGASVPAEMALASAAAVTAGTASYESSKYQEGIAKNNQALANQNEANAQAAGNSAEQQQEQKNSQQMGAIRAAFSANGIDVNSGSASQVQDAQEQLGQTDLKNINNNFQNQAKVGAYQATNSGNEAALYNSQANFAIPSAILNSTSSVNPKWKAVSGSTTTGINGSGGMDSSNTGSGVDWEN